MHWQKAELGFDDYSDDELVRLFRGTRQDVYFAELFGRHGKNVFYACMAFSRNSAAAEDLTQETFLRAHQAIDAYESGDFRGWLLRIARNACIDRYRRARPEVGYDDAPQAAVSGVDRIGTSVHLALLQLEQEMAELPADQRRCLELKAAGYSYEELAQAVGGSTEDVRSHLQNGRRMLRLRMAESIANLL